MQRTASVARIALAMSVGIGAGLAPYDVAFAKQRTFVRSDGVDANPCSITAPCRSFGAAMALTAAGGEIIVLDSAGYGKVTVTQSVSIIAPQGIYAGISVFPGEDGVTINSAGAAVVLRNLPINGQGGNTGIRIAAASRVHINATYGICISTSSTFSLNRSRVERNGFNGMGVDVVAPTSLTIAESLIATNSGHGLLLRAGNPTQSTVSVSTTELVANTLSGIDALSAGSGGLLQLAVARSTLRGNGARGAYLLTTSPGIVAADSTTTSSLRTARPSSSRTARACP